MQAISVDFYGLNAYNDISQAFKRDDHSDELIVSIIEKENKQLMEDGNLGLA